MSKKLLEINKFNKGITTTISSQDADEEIPKYSRNVDGYNNEGKLQGISENRVLTTSGFQDIDSTKVEGKEKYVKDITYKFYDDHHSGHPHGHPYVNYGTDLASTITLLKSVNSTGNGSNIGSRFQGAIRVSGVFAEDGTDLSSTADNLEDIYWIQFDRSTIPEGCGDGFSWKDQFFGGVDTGWHGVPYYTQGVSDSETMNPIMPTGHNAFDSTSLIGFDDGGNQQVFSGLKYVDPGDSELPDGLRDPSAGAIIDATCDTTSGSLIVTMDNNATPDGQSLLNYKVSGTGIVEGTYVDFSHPDLEQITLSQNATASNTNVTLTFSPNRHVGAWKITERGSLKTGTGGYNGTFFGPNKNSNCGWMFGIDKALNYGTIYIFSIEKKPRLLNSCGSKAMAAFKIIDTGFTNHGWADNGFEDWSNQLEHFGGWDNNGYGDGFNGLINPIEIDLSADNSNHITKTFFEGISAYLNNVTTQTSLNYQMSELVKDSSTTYTTGLDGYITDFKVNFNEGELTTDSISDGYDLAKITFKTLKYSTSDFSHVFPTCLDSRCRPFASGLNYGSDLPGAFSEPIGDGDDTIYHQVSTTFPYGDLPIQNTLSVDLIEFASMIDSKDENKTHVVGLGGVKLYYEETNELFIQRIPQTVKIIEDIYSDSPTNERILKVLGGTSEGIFDVSGERDKVFIGLGKDAVAQVVMHTEKNPMHGESIEAGLASHKAALTPPTAGELTEGFSDYFHPIILGTDANTYQGQHDGTLSASMTLDGATPPNNKSYFDYDYSLDNSNGTFQGQNLYESLDSSSGIAGFRDLEPGQVFMLQDDGGTHGSENDSLDNALLGYKRLEWWKSAVLRTNDLFMFVGYGNGDEPIVSYIGNMNEQGGNPAYTYALKDNDSRIYRISNIGMAHTHTDNQLWDVALDVGNVKALNGSTDITVAGYTSGKLLKRFPSLGSNPDDNMITSVDLNQFGDFTGNISSLNFCSSPPVYNTIGLKSSGENPYSFNADTLGSNLFFNSGDPRIYYRHNVFWVASTHYDNKLFRVNLIDWLGSSTNYNYEYYKVMNTSNYMTGNGAGLESIDLNFNKIPTQLQAENGTGIIRRTIEDQITTDSNVDPLNEDWNHIPSDSQIISICETFDCGDIIEAGSGAGTGGATFTNHNDYYFKTRHNSRLSTGEKVKFRGLANDTDAKKRTLYEEPHTVYCTHPDEHVIELKTDQDIDVNVSFGGPPTYKRAWWNCKVWVMYGKKTPGVSHKNWDMFLYNANTLDMENGLVMADRTPPYSQARWYINTDSSDDSSSPSVEKVYYPGQQIFIAGDVPMNDTSYPEGYTNEHVIKHGDNLTGWDESEHGAHAAKNTFCIYDKTGRWGQSGPDLVLPLDTWDVFLFDDAVMPGGWGGGHEWNFNEIQDELILGNNIGWDVDTGRKIDTVRASLIPSVPYSRVYMAAQYFKGIINVTDGNTEYSSDDINHMFGDSELADGGYDNIHKTHNRPKHAVSFLGRTTGDFVVSPGIISRVNSDNNSSDQGAHTPWVYKSGNHDAIGSTENIGIKNYSDDITLYEIDDYSGHKGIVKHFNSNAIGDFENTQNSKDYVGLQHCYPNAGGPEIENPYYRTDIKEFIGYNTGGNTSINNGLIDYENEDATSRGWEGYSPPRLFEAGSGYYIYINRTWRSASPAIPALMDNLFWDSEGEDPYADSGYKSLGHLFQIGPKNPSLPNADGVGNTKSDMSPHRWYNFSTTALAQYASPHNNGLADDNPYSFSGFRYLSSDYGGDSMESMYIDKYRRIHSPWTPSSVEGSEVRDNSIMRVNPGSADAICTMHKIKTPGYNPKILSVDSTVYRHKWATSENLSARKMHDFTNLYILGASNDEKSGILIVRSNLNPLYGDAVEYWAGNMTSDAVNHTTLIDGGSIIPDATNNWFHAPYAHQGHGIGLVRVGIGDVENAGDGNYGANLTPGAPYQEYSTHNLEIVDISDNSNYSVDTQFLAATGDQTIAQAFFLEFPDTLISDNLSTWIWSNISSRLTMTGAATDGNVVIGTVNNEGTQDDVEAGGIIPVRWMASNAAKDKTLVGESTHNASIDIVGDVTIESYAESGSGIPAKFFMDVINNQTTVSDIIPTVETDARIMQFVDDIISFTIPSAVQDGTFAPGTYQYKMAWIYDEAYNSPLQPIAAFQVELPVNDSITNAGYKHIQLDFNFSNISDMNPRVTGLSIYRKDGEAGNYLLIDDINFNDNTWYRDEGIGAWRYTYKDKNNQGPAYTTVTGLPESMTDSSLNYSLSATNRGYFYVSGVDNLSNTLKNVDRYVFRSQPDNFFSFDWTNDYIIMPEQPIAMVSFQSRLYIWGKKRLYKVDPFNLTIEDQYEGISIAHKQSYSKTEFGLCFLDKNNIYLHDGNVPRPIGDPILYSSSPVLYNNHGEGGLGTEGIVRIEQGYCELIKSTLHNNYVPNVDYLGKTNSFIINLVNSTKNGVGFIYSINRNRWDYIDFPRPVSVSTGIDSSLLLNDGNFLYDLVSTSSKEYSDYNKKRWDWVSKDLTFGMPTQEKVFKSIVFSGTPSLYNYQWLQYGFPMDQKSTEYICDSVKLGYGDANLTTTTDVKYNSIQAFVDGVQINLNIVVNKYDVINLGDTTLFSNFTTASEDLDSSEIYCEVQTKIRKESTLVGVNDDIATDIGLQKYMLPGHYIKINDDIFLIKINEVKVVDPEGDETYNHINKLILDSIPIYDTYNDDSDTSPNNKYCKKLQTYTEGTTHLAGSAVNIVNPRLTFPPGTKGKVLEIRMLKQFGFIDSLGIIYKYKKIK